MKKLASILLPVLLVWLLAACDPDTMSLPQVEHSGDTTLGADTTWLKLTTNIELPLGSAVRDVFIDDDGHIYAADSALGIVRVWDQALNDITMETFQDTLRLPGVRSLAVGPEQLLFLADGSARIYSFNLQANRLPVVAAYRDLRFSSDETGEFDLSIEEFARVVEGYGLTGEFLVDLVQYQRLGDLTLVGGTEMAPTEWVPLAGLQVLYEGGSTYSIDAVSGGRSGHRELFYGVSKPAGDEISHLFLVPYAVLFTSDPDVPLVYLYEEGEEDQIGYPGTGAGSVWEPRALEVDPYGDIYLVNSTGSLIPVQRLEWEYYGNENWSYDANLYEGEISALGFFSKPLDVTYTNDKILVADEGARCIKVFNTSGDYLYPCGASRILEPELYTNRGVLTDTTLVIDGISYDTTVAVLDTVYTIDGALVDSTLILAAQTRFIKSWEYDQLISPQSVAVFGNRSDRTSTYDETVFVADQDSLGSTIYLFQLSISSDDLPTQ